MPSQRTFRRYRAIAEELARRIADGEYGAGERLPSERELVEELKVSRPTLREALIALEIMGYVAVRGGSGIYVTETGQPQPEVDLGIGTFELLEARKIIEADIAKIAAQTVSNEQLMELREVIEQQIKGFDQDNRVFETADRRFHVLIAEATDNSALAFVVEELWKFRRASDIWRLIDARSDVDSLRSRAIEDHIRICAALEARDPNRAFDAMHQHMQNNIDWRLSKSLHVPAVSDTDRRTQLRLRLERELELGRSKNPG